MTTKLKEHRASLAEKRAQSPYLDLSTQVLVPRHQEEEHEGAVDAARVRHLLLQGRSGTPFWGDEPGLYDVVRFGKNIFLPGRCKMTGKGFEQKVQRDKPPGTHGSSLKQLGCQPAKIDIRLQLWTREHLEAFSRLVPILKAQRYVTETSTEDSGFSSAINGQAVNFSSAHGPIITKRAVPAGPAPVEVYHPMLALFRIRSIHVLSVGIPAPTSDGDIFETSIICEEFVPGSGRASAVKKADASKDLIIEKNVGKTAATMELERRLNALKPSQVAWTGSAGGTVPGVNGGSSGGW